MNNVAYETEAAEGSTGRCPIQLQRETPTGLVDTICGSEVQQKQAGLCRYAPAANYLCSFTTLSI